MIRRTRYRGFIFIWGRKTRLRRDMWVEPCDCARCGGKRSVLGFVQESAPTLYFIPIGDFAGNRKFRQCSICRARPANPAPTPAPGNRSTPPPLPGSIAAAPAQPPVLVACSTCGEALRSAGAFCSRCGRGVNQPTDWLKPAGWTAIAVSAAMVVFAVAMRIHGAESAETSSSSTPPPALVFPPPMAIASPTTLPNADAGNANSAPQPPDDAPVPVARQQLDPEDIPVVLEKTPILGSGSDGSPYEKRKPIIEPILGFRIEIIQWGKRTILHTFEPIYGSDYLLPTADMAVAKPGYAVGGIIADGENQVTAIRIVFMRISDHGLDPKDSYKSDWFGKPTDPDAFLLGGNGDPVVGIYGRKGMNFAALGLILLRTEHPKPDHRSQPAAPQASIRQ